MRYHLTPDNNKEPLYGTVYICDHPVYTRCTLFKIDIYGLAVIQQRFDPETKRTWWSEIDPWLNDVIFLHPSFKNYFVKRGCKPVNGLYPTVTVRQIMWGLRIKPLRRERWETVFDRKLI